MENATLSFLSIFLLTLSLHVTADLPPSPSPSPSPQSPSPSPSPSQAITPSPYNHPPASSPVVSFPPPPSPSIPITSSSSPAPSPEDSNSINHIGVDDGTDDSSGEGMSGSKKAGIAIGIIVAASVLMLAGMVYKKRKQNIRRNQYNYAVGRDIVL
ncbi:alpha carbonic anhydrase [Trifolium repens]|jgi:hypothetical protein|nr:alpha carbonic anhydrase [Trifolium repens]